MHHHYADIVDRIDEQPRWWDENAVPRFCEFHPVRLANIYADTAVLLRIECQGCGTPFLVAFSESNMSRYGWVPENPGRTAPPTATWGVLPDSATLEGQVKSGAIHFGDPPHTGCCNVGPTMNSIPREVVQFWRRERFDWRRVPELERRIRCDWAGPEAAAEQREEGGRPAAATAGARDQDGRS